MTDPTTLADLLRPDMAERSAAPMRIVLRELDTIEAARRAGVGYDAIAAALARLGTPMSASTLRQLVHRARQRRAQAQAPAQASELVSPAATTAPSPGEPDGAPRTAGATPGRSTRTSSGPAAPPRGNADARRRAEPAPGPTAAARPRDAGAAHSALGGSGTLDPQAITDILNSQPDLDALARRFRQSQRSTP